VPPPFTIKVDTCGVDTMAVYDETNGKYPIGTPTLIVDGYVQGI
jgi:hypothetical protein